MDITQIKLLCRQYDIVPSKKMGQNFLIDENIVSRIIEAADLGQPDTVLEVGPGFGILTGELAKRAGSVLAVELDKRALDFLGAEFGGIKNLKIIPGDILKINLSEIGLKNFGFKIVANLPYSITSKFLRLFLENSSIKPKEMILMVQKEVAERLTAKPGEMSILGVAAQFFAEPDILFKISKNSFWPEPKVDSAVICLKLNEKLPDLDKKRLFQLVKIGFSGRRKQLHNNLSAGFGRNSEDIKTILKKAGLDEKVRAQDLSLFDWEKILIDFI